MLCRFLTSLGKFETPSFALSSFHSRDYQASGQQDPLVSNVASILIHQRSKSRWSTIMSLYPSGFTPAQFSEITIHIRNNSHLAWRFFLFTRRHSLCSHDLLSLSSLIHILARSRLKCKALEIMHLAIRSARNSKGSSFSESRCLVAVFKSLARTYNRCGSAPFVFDLLVKSCLDSKKVDSSVIILRLLRSKGISLQIDSCNALISEISRRRGVCEGYKIYKEIFGLDVGTVEGVRRISMPQPNAQTFNILMVSFYREGKLEKLEDIWGEMEELGCSPNSYSYSFLIEVFCERGMIGKAEQIWEELGSKGFKRDVIAYNAMIGGLCKRGKMRQSEELYKDMGLNSVGSTAVTYNHLVSGYCGVGDVDSAMLVYRDMLRKVFDPDRSTVEVLIRGLCEKGRILEALETMRSASKHFAFSPTEKCYEVLIEGYCKKGLMDEASKLQAEMVGKGFEPNLAVYTAFIKGFAAKGDQKMAVSLTNEMAEFVL